MKTILFFIVLIPILVNLQNHRSSHAMTNNVVKLEKIWESDTSLTANESAVYDAVTNAVYVSCMGNSDDTVDGDGFIARLDLRGAIQNLHWVSGLNCPKGLAIYKNHLLTIDINELVTIELSSGKVISKKNLGEGKHFNDIDVAPDGRVFLSESYTSEIVRHFKGKTERYHLSPETSGLNGVHVSANKLVFTGNKGTIYSLSDDLKTTVLADSCFRPDGIEAYRGGYFCSSWQGKIYYFVPGGNTVTLINTVPEKLQGGDIDVVEDKKILLCPTLFNNKVIAYRIVD